MKTDLYRIVGSVLATIIAVMGAGAALHLLVTIPYPDNKGAEWIAAIGTVGTLIGTIVIATSESRRRERNERLVAIMRAHSHVPKIAVIKATANTVLEHLRQVSNGDLPGRIMSRAADQLCALNCWTIDEIAPLAPLSHRAVIQLTQAREVLILLQHMLGPQLRGIFEDRPKDEAPKLMQFLCNLCWLLDCAETELHAAVRKFEPVA